MEIVVRGRNVAVPDHYRQHVAEKLDKLSKYDHKLIRVDVELQHERNPRQSDICQRVEITVRSKGPVVRAEAVAADFYSALDTAVSRVEARIRKAADRRRVHRGSRTPRSLAEAAAAAEAVNGAAELDRLLDAEEEYSEDGMPGRVVREKVHPATPMTVDQALEAMELVGHDFYLFQCADTDTPTVVYRRHAYDYGLIRLTADAAVPVSLADVGQGAGHAEHGLNGTSRGGAGQTELHAEEFKTEELTTEELTTEELKTEQIEHKLFSRV